MVSETRHVEFGIRNSESEAKHSAFRIPHSAFGRGQATLEMTVAIIGALVLLVGSVKITLWAAERYFTRVKNYDLTRKAAASAPAGTPPDTSYEPTTKLKIF